MLLFTFWRFPPYICSIKGHIKWKTTVMVDTRNMFISGYFIAKIDFPVLLSTFYELDKYQRLHLTATTSKFNANGAPIELV
jgi:hypothetical protein